MRGFRLSRYDRPAPSSPIVKHWHLPALMRMLQRRPARNKPVASNQTTGLAGGNGEGVFG